VWEGRSNRLLGSKRKPEGGEEPVPKSLSTKEREELVVNLLRAELEQGREIALTFSKGGEESLCDLAGIMKILL